MNGLRDSRTDLAHWLRVHAGSLSDERQHADAVLPGLAEAGLLGVGVPVEQGGLGGDIGDAVEAIASVGAASMAAASVLWAQQTFIECLLMSFNVGLREYRLPSLLDGSMAGTTGLLDAMEPGNRQVPVTARDHGRGWHLDGSMPRMPNVRPAGYLVAAPVASDGNPGFSILMLASDQDGLRTAGDHDGAHAASIDVRRVHFREDELLHADGPAFARSARPAFVGLHCGLAIGLARSAIQSLQHGEGIAVAVSDTTAALLAGLRNGSFHADPQALSKLRLRLAELAHEAVQAEQDTRSDEAPQPNREAARKRQRELALLTQDARI